MYPFRLRRNRAEFPSKAARQMRRSDDGDQENDARQISGRKWSISFRGGVIRKICGFWANKYTRYRRHDSADAAALWHSFSERKNGVLAAPFVVLTSIRRSRPSGSKERISYPAPSPSSADTHFFQKVGPLKFFELLSFHLYNKFFARSTQRTVAQIAFHGIEFSNQTFKLPRPLGSKL